MRSLIASLLFSTMLLTALPSRAAGPMTADDTLKKLHADVWQMMLDGNKRYRDGAMQACLEKSSPEIRSELAKGQKPFAIVLSCSDSRVPPEIIFDKGPGEIFVVRVAGNIVDPAVLGSIEYAADHLKTPMIVVLGHERCGAVTAAVEEKKGEKAEGNLAAILDVIHPSVTKVRSAHPELKGAELVEAAADENVRTVSKNLVRQSKVLANLVAIGKLKIVSAKFDLDDGKVSEVAPTKEDAVVVESKPKAKTPKKKKDEKKPDDKKSVVKDEKKADAPKKEEPKKDEKKAE